MIAIKQRCDLNHAAIHPAKTTIFILERPVQIGMTGITI